MKLFRIMLSSGVWRGLFRVLSYFGQHWFKEALNKAELVSQELNVIELDDEEKPLNQSFLKL